ncbi:hypothetical protein OG230_17090 [Streptomyces sp. NBC_00234]
MPARTPALRTGRIGLDVSDLEVLRVPGAAFAHDGVVPHGENGTSGGIFLADRPSLPCPALPRPLPGRETLTTSAARGDADAAAPCWHPKDTAATEQDMT